MGGGGGEMGRWGEEGRDDGGGGVLLDTVLFIRSSTVMR